MEETKAGRGRGEMLIVIAAAVVAGLIFKTTQFAGLNHTALLFVGIPAILAVLVTLTPRPGSANGVVIKATTPAMLLAGTVFGEAFICILMASPLIYFVALVIAGTARWGSRKMGRRGAAHAPLLVLMVALAPAMEGVTPGLSLPRDAAVQVTRTVDASPAQVREAIAAPLRFDRPLPRFLRLGFPTPGETAGSGSSVGDVRRVTLVHGQHHSGELVMRVSAAGPGRVVFTPVSDESYITHWLAWKSAEVRWRAVPGGTEVTWTLRYRRRLDPAWYFGPLEQHGVRLAAGYLVETVATPRGGG